MFCLASLFSTAQLLASDKPLPVNEDISTKAVEAPKTGDYQTSYAEVLKYIKTNNDAKALDVLREMAKDYPGDVQVQNNLAVLLTRQKKYEQAQKIFETLLTNNPEYGVVFNNLNELYAFQAQKAYKQVFADSPLVRPKGNLLTLNKTPEAIAELDRLKSDPAKRKSFELIETQVRKALEDWRIAWTKQRYEAYINAYVPDFKVEGLETHEQWAKQRKWSVLGPSKIEVKLSDIELLIVNDDLVSASFVQNYQSNRYQDSIKKVLYFKRLASGWKISQEMTVEVFLK
ncbi:L,D-transpeptidase Cds6 family protein [Thiosulfativibrio zosterae]|uniref:Cds6 C-terminal domain-containing protein n=1 Tax=Thiosulfativibrio zosterae TaxID=2675053 RepID=A0A6F8PKZ3_9GAMM|nr:tetratricopeptide repeat protein [Thiosulfativibrio zosterae]BBP42772.1 hypothetical protein THMIRHAT_05180 [Thiosulfativibrio zosterae]